MLIYVVRRLVWALMLFFVITLIAFVMFFVLPGDSTNAQRNQQGFGQRPADHVQPPRFVRQRVRSASLERVVVHADLGDSTRSEDAVTDEIEDTLPITASLVIGGMLFCLLIAIPIGILSALTAALADRQWA